MSYKNNMYPTLSNGFFRYEYFLISNIEPINYIDIDTILLDICNVNFYIKYDIQKKEIYLSLDCDEIYYIYQFERQFKTIVNKLNTHFNINIIYGEFYANEIKCGTFQYVYIITKNNNNKLTIKKKNLNSLLENTKSGREQDEEDDVINNNLHNLKII